MKIEQELAWLFEIVKAWSWLLYHKISHSHTQLTLAACRALEFSLKLGFDKAILKGDSMIVMAALRDTSPSLASYGLLL